MSDAFGPMGGGSVFDYITPIQDPQDPILDLKKLALNMLKQTILDIADPKQQSQALLWVNDEHPDTLGWVTSFDTVCWLLDRDKGRTRRILNRYAASGMDIKWRRPEFPGLDQKSRPSPKKKTGRRRRSTGSRRKRP